MEKNDDSPVGEMTPRTVSKWKGLGITVTGMGVVIAGVIAAVIVSTVRPQPRSSIAAPGPVTGTKATAGQNRNPVYNRQVAAQNAMRAAEAATTGESMVATPTGPVQGSQSHQDGPLETSIEVTRSSLPPPTVSFDLPPARPARSGAMDTSQSVSNEYRAHRDQKNDVTIITQYLQAVDKDWTLVQHTHQVVAASATGSSDPPAASGSPGRSLPQSEAGSRAAELRSDSPVTIRPGVTLYAINEYRVDSDIGSRVVARVVGGDFRGARFIGDYRVSGGYLVLAYKRLVLPSGTVLDVDAVGIDPARRQMAVRSDIDRHLLTRWGTFLSATWLAAVGAKLEQSGTTSVISAGAGGTTTVTQQPRLDTREINEMALGRLAAEVASASRPGLARPDTITLDHDAEIGVLILAAPTRAQQLETGQQG